MKKEKKRNAAVLQIMLLVLALALISGVEECPVPGAAPPAKTGLDFSLVKDIDTISAGQEIRLEDTFYVAVRIENYDRAAKTGTVCIRDDIAAGYGGVAAEDCQPFFVRGAEEIPVTYGSPRLEPGSVDIYFPTAGQYSYENMPISQTVKLFVAVKYLQHSRIESLVPVPEPASESLKLQQEPAPIVAGVKKSVRAKGDAWRVLLEIKLTKQQAEAKIFSPDWKEGLLTFGTAGYFELDCRPEGAYSLELWQRGLLEFEKEKFISCSALVYERAQTTYPFIITLDYGVQLNKTWPFRVKVG